MLCWQLPSPCLHRCCCCCWFEQSHEGGVCGARVGPGRLASDVSTVAMPLQVLFDFFSSTLESEITLAKSMGNYETGEGYLAG